jgi:hypothetical protein
MAVPDLTWFIKNMDPNGGSGQQQQNELRLQNHIFLDQW